MRGPERPKPFLQQPTDGGSGSQLPGRISDLARFARRISEPQIQSEKGLKKSTATIVQEAKEDALRRISEDPTSIRSDVLQRVEHAINGPFASFVEEANDIAEQLESREYTINAEDIANFLQAKIGYVVCPDGRILQIAFSLPKAGSVHRRLGGLPQTRETSAAGDYYVLKDPIVAASINTELQNRKEDEKPLEVVEEIGGHFDSMNPDNPKRRCGALTLWEKASGRPIARAMRFGGIPQFFARLGKGWEAVESVTEAAVEGAKATTIDMFFDTHSQGLVFGLKKAHDKFDWRLSLRQNLDQLHRAGEILMTEYADPELRPRIFELAALRGIEDSLEIKDYRKLAQNLIHISQIARELTIEDEEAGFASIPAVLKEGKNNTALRVMSYTKNHNVAYRVLGNITPGEHDLLEHPEQLIQMGPIGARCNVDTIPFIQSTSRGEFDDVDMNELAGLYGLSEEVLENQGVNLVNEGRVILVTGRFRRSAYNTDRDAREFFNEVAAVVRHNAYLIRTRFKEAIPTGELIVIGCIFDPDTGKLTHVLSKRNDKLDPLE